ncbi:MAG: PEP-CTERM sorting domain-containing protein [Gloeocapsa sp. DLM2.Bin57]|nr:MAG: PEP-CTERM sorting domain-containing protein [Gloeocapsa sp. DLM2.Bin57]
MSLSVTYSQLLGSANARSLGISVNGGPTFPTTPGDSGTVTVNYSNDNLVGTSFDFFALNDDDTVRFRLVDATFEAIPEPLTILGTGFAVAALPALKKAHKKAQK